MSQQHMLVLRELGGGLRAIGEVLDADADVVEALRARIERLESELAELNATTVALEVRTREAERLRISRELHDIAGHHLTAMALELEVAQRLTAGAPGGDHVSNARSMAKELLAEVRAAVGEMRDELPSLVDGFNQLASRVPGVTITADVDPSITTTNDENVALLRCAQEAITNAIRQSEADTIQIRVSTSDRGITFLATDNGAGTRTTLTPGVGLTGMTERFAALGGELTVNADPHLGVAVKGWLPRPCEARAVR